MKYRIKCYCYKDGKQLNVFTYADFYEKYDADEMLKNLVKQFLADEAHKSFKIGFTTENTTEVINGSCAVLFKIDEISDNNRVRYDYQTCVINCEYDGLSGIDNWLNWKSDDGWELFSILPKPNSSELIYTFRRLK